ncbi:MAG: hypothetical protein KJ658_21995, partial [Proteobacteria bacterium]|nr:hypothetical protein [Pseudomonadota bacterium]
PEPTPEPTPPPAPPTPDPNNQTLYGTSAPGILSGGTGNDTLWGYAGNDTLYGDDSGDDSITGDDVLYGGDDDDRLDGGPGNDALYGEGGEDKLIGGPGNDTLDGGPFDPKNNFDSVTYQDDPAGIVGTLSYNYTTKSFAGSSITDGWGNTDILSNVSTIYGSAYNDTLTVNLTGTDDKFEGSWHLWGAAGADSLTGSANGNVFAMYLDSPASVNVDLAAGTAVDGFGSTDTLVNIRGASGSSYQDTLNGSGNDDGFIGSLANDSINGGAGDHDWVSYNWLKNSDSDFSGVNIVLETSPGTLIGTATGKNSVPADIFTDTLTNIENAWGSDFNDTITGTDGENWLGGEDGNDIINGGPGTDWLMGGKGNDTLDGGDFSGTHPKNYAVYKGDPDFNSDGNGVSVSIVYDTTSGGTFAGTTATDGWGNSDTLQNISRVIGSDFNDVLSITITELGGASDVRWYMWGMGGDDTLTGTAGERTRAMYLDDPGSVTVNLTSGTATDGWGDHDTLTNIEAVSGSNYAPSGDVLTGSANGDGFFATFGNDTIDGLASDMDWIDYSFLDGKSNFFSADVDLSTGVAKGLDSGAATLFTDTLINVEDVYGSAQADKIIGSTADNWLSGNDGNDILNGFTGGVDTLEGGAGSDQFELMEFTNPDIIKDFTITGTPDLIRFKDTAMGHSADGGTSFSSAFNGSPIDPTAFKMVAITDVIGTDWNVLSNVAAIIDPAVSGVSMTDGTTDDTYFLIHNGTNARIYYWDGDVNLDDTVNDTELTQMAELTAVNDFTGLADSHFDFT